MRGSEFVGMCGICNNGLSHCRCEPIAGDFGAGRKGFFLQQCDFVSAKAGDTVRVYHVYESDPDPFSPRHRPAPVTSCLARVVERSGRNLRLTRIKQAQ